MEELGSVCDVLFVAVSLLSDICISKGSKTGCHSFWQPVFCAKYPIYAVIRQSGFVPKALPDDPMSL